MLLNLRTLATGSKDKTVKLWDMKTGKLAVPFLQHERGVLDARFSKNGQQLVVAASDETGGEFRVWNTATGEQISADVQDRVDSVLYQASFDSNGKQILTASYDGTAALWDSSTGRMLAAPLRHKNGVLMGAFSPNAQFAVTASYDGTARLWSIADAVSRVWSPEDPGSVSTILRHSSYVLQALFSKNGQRVLTASTDGLIREWELPLQSPDVVGFAHSNSVLHATFNRDGTRVATASVDRTARVWNSATGAPVTPSLRHGGAVNHVAFSPDGMTIVTASTDGTARLWDATTGRQIAPEMKHSNTVWHAEFSADGRLVATASGKFRNLAAKSSRVLRDFSTTENPQANIDGEARVWNARSGQALTPPLTHSDAVVHLSFNRDSTALVSASADGTAQLWSVPDGKPLGQPMRQTGQVFRSAFHPARNWIVTVGGGGGKLRDNAARFWDSRTSQPLSQKFEHADIIYYAQFNSRGDRLVTGSEDGTARVWDVETGRPVTPPIENGAVALQAVASPDDRFVLTASVDGTARVWDARNGELVAQLRLHKDRINTAAFSADGRRILTASDDGMVKLSPLPRTPWSVQDLHDLARVLSAGRIDANGTEVPLDERSFREIWVALTHRFPDLFSVYEQH